MSAQTSLRRAGRVAGFGALTAALVPGMLAHAALAWVTGRSVDAVRDAWVARWSGATLALFGVTLHVDGALPPRGRPLLVVSNHRSTADVLVLLRTFGGRMVSRADLARWPLIGLAARSVGTVFVDRDNAGSGASALRSMRSQLARGSSVVVFPEGTTYPDDDVRPFRPGAFVAAVRAGADVLPVGLAYERGSGAIFFGESFPAHLARMAAAEPSRVVLCVGSVLSARGRRARDLCAEARVGVAEQVRRARALVDGTG